MMVRRLIELLQQLDPTLPVCLADWNEEYAVPSEQAAESVRVVTREYDAAGAEEDEDRVFGTFVQIGDDGDG